MKTNREEILKAALVEFSKKGYEGALLRDIAASLGITKPALYKHFESKEALWNEMIDYLEAYYQEHISAVSDIRIPKNWEEFRELSLKQIQFTLNDETVKRVRRLLTLEQFRNERMSALATKYFLTSIEERYQKIFEGMMKNGILRTTDSELLAFQFTAPVTVMIHLCDREPDRKQEIMDKIDAHIRQFSLDYEVRSIR
ncbi:MAG: TetR/AcrR family transcriptional regulator [Lachnospiraceae bacterium]